MIQNTKQIADYTNIRKNMLINRLKMIIKLNIFVIFAKKLVTVYNLNTHMKKCKKIIQKPLIVNKIKELSKEVNKLKFHKYNKPQPDDEHVDLVEITTTITIGQKNIY